MTHAALYMFSMLILYLWPMFWFAHVGEMFGKRFNGKRPRVFDSKQKFGLKKKKGQLDEEIASLKSKKLGVSYFNSYLSSARGVLER